MRCVCSGAFQVFFLSFYKKVTEAAKFRRICDKIKKTAKGSGAKMSGTDFVRLEEVTKVYQMGEVAIRAVDGISFSINKGEFVIIVGPSGAGKTTVLNILGGMDTASSGKVLVDGKKNVARFSKRELTTFRRNDIGFVFQFYNLVPNLTALENVELAMQICRHPLDARKVLEEVGLGEGWKLSCPAFRRRAAAGVHRPCAGQKSETAFVR